MVFVKKLEPRLKSGHTKALVELGEGKDNLSIYLVLH